ncbi:DUF742 domain-containing protein [Saccharopolyspora rectivirgula]|jgi:hypothetical protein|uniref:Multi-component regulatory system-8 n=1 Tax=Saccharopolyspora rectivirgula TaxID=28042 RepID=A0A073AUY8_9PSEU|nr:DUF742 domain-containing protein [Saccharopolyspora rectivirgula]KEI43136.1 hypothetical protein GU90_18610 [Saccharopolyspora rectivirgula]
MATNLDSTGRHHLNSEEDFDGYPMVEVYSRYSVENSDSLSGEDTDETASEEELPPPGWPDISSEETENPVPDAENTGLASCIRPYTWTGGRTQTRHRFELETLVSTSELCDITKLQRLEHQSIADICRTPRSVAEVGAMLSIPLGVVKVLLGDMADLNLITVHSAPTSSGSEAHLQLMERVLTGLRNL